VNGPWPPAPWTLRGRALHTVQLVPVREVVAREVVPRTVKVVSVLPGFTAGGVYVARYGPGSTLEYSELIAVAALVRRSGRVGIWISDIFVDSDASIAGGRAIWALDKQRAEFEWSDDGVTVRCGGKFLCSVTAPRAISCVPIAATVPAFGMTDAPPHFRALVRTRMSLCRADWEIPAESPFAFLGSGGRRTTVLHYHLDARILPPCIVNP
jgi:acetoacetate decarboxylase